MRLLTIFLKIFSLLTGRKRVGFSRQLRPVVSGLFCLSAILFSLATTGWSQCNALRPQIDINFNTDQDCAPVTVTEFRITYYFNAPQDPNTIQILYEWNDPANSTTVVGNGTGLVVGASASGPNTAFTANATFLYTTNNNQCNITPTSYIVINGQICVTSQQVQTAFYWDTDNEANGVVEMAPQEWDVCYDNPVLNAVFRDASEFNCNINVEPDNPNRAARHVQFVYGTNHNPAATIRNLTLNDGSVQNLTDGTGALASSATRGTGGLPVTAAYFGPIVTIPFPADGPNAQTFPMNAPANASNAVGNRFEITLFNWNMCNPWNGDPVNPNYEDAIITTGYIVIVEAPQPSFFTQDADGNAATNFCIGETISFRNTTVNVTDYTYTWRFYDDAAGLNLIHTSTQRHPNFAFTSGGTKLIRVVASNPTAQSPCVEEFSATVEITPSMAAAIGVTDLNGVPITPDFCQEPDAPLTSFDVRFTDISTGTPTPTTARRWEFYDETNSLVFESPAGGGFAIGVAGPFDRVFINPGVYRVRLRIQDNITGCESTDDVQVRVFEKPDVDFTFTRVCETFTTAFTDITTLNPVMAEQIIAWEWDMDYDGVTFSKDPTLDNQQNFNYVFPSAGSFRVALRVTTDIGSCIALADREVIVDPLPSASFTADRSTGCSTLQVNFTNTSINGQPDVVSEYQWEVDEGSGFQLDATQRPTDPDFSSQFTRDFLNTGATDRDYRVRLRVITTNGCETVSPPQTITVYPAPRSGFVSLDYSPFNSNCSPVPVSFAVDEETQLMNPTEYLWTISDADGVLSQTSTGTTPSFDFTFVNSTQALEDYFVTLRASLPSGCFGDSTRVIRVSPVPGSEFDLTNVSQTCDRVNLNLNALQKGLQKYEWTIISNGVTLFSTSSEGDAFDYEVMRSPAVDQTIEVQLVTENFANCRSVVTSHTIPVGNADDINASFTATPPSQQYPEATVTINNTTNDGPWQYTWDFGDGTVSNNAAVTSHLYEEPGTYTITLTVTSENCTEIKTATIEITPASPVLDFAYDPPSGCSPLTVNFTNLTQFADESTYQWNFGTNQGTSNAINPSYTYHEPGVYSVTLTASNVAGESAQITKQFIIEVFDQPNAAFNIKPRQIQFPGGRLYTDNQSFGASSYHWDFGDGNTSTDFEPEHIYTSEGVFDIMLVATNGLGCSDTTVLEAGVETIRSGQMLVPNAFSPNLTGPGNSGGQNDMFRPILRGVTEFQMLVFNRWGELLFETKNPEVGWDGYYQGRLCQQDVYVYKIIAKYSDGQTITRVGDIHLMR